MSFWYDFPLKGFRCGEEEEQRKESKSKAGSENESETPLPLLWFDCTLSLSFHSQMPGNYRHSTLFIFSITLQIYVNQCFQLLSYSLYFEQAHTHV